MRDQSRTRGLFAVRGVVAAIAVLGLAMMMPAVASSNGSSPTGTSTITPASGGSLSDQISVTDTDGASITYVNITFPAGTVITSDSATVTLTTSDGSTVTGTCYFGGSLGPATASCGFPTQTAGFTFTVTIVTSQPVTAGSTVTMTLIGGGNTYGPFTQTWAAVCPTITIGPTMLPDGTVGSPYSGQLTASPPSAGPFTFTATPLGGGTSPFGVSSSGVITGDPQTSGIHGVTVTVTGANGCTATQNVTILVNEAPLTLSLSAKPALIDFHEASVVKIAFTDPNPDAGGTALQINYPSGAMLTSLPKECTTATQRATCFFPLGAITEIVYGNLQLGQMGAAAITASVAETGVTYGSSASASTEVTAWNPHATIARRLFDLAVADARVPIIRGVAGNSTGRAADVATAGAAAAAVVPPIRLVQIALLRLGNGDHPVATFARAGCRWLRSAKVTFSTTAASHGACDTPIWVSATGTTRWHYTLRHRLPPGRYVLFARATDSAGVSEVLFTAALHNRLAFRVR